MPDVRVFVGVASVPYQCHDYTLPNTTPERALAEVRQGWEYVFKIIPDVAAIVPASWDWATRGDEVFIEDGGRIGPPCRVVDPGNRILVNHDGLTEHLPDAQLWRRI